MAAVGRDRHALDGAAMSGQHRPGRGRGERQPGRDHGADNTIMPDREHEAPSPSYSMSKGWPVTERPRLAVSGATMEPARRARSAVSISL